VKEIVSTICTTRDDADNSCEVLLKSHLKARQDLFCLFIALVAILCSEKISAMIGFVVT
jgi:hypothetical protein